ncbi:helix-turn-helix domain-containing protein [Mycobacterium interjectum]|uniref:helix-turn-helix domain-containing protein n=1 Tax=Mycobacterium interjectum TaxID=33895 RepID=UPI000A06D0DC|nr:helix-turn-helix domain-containing protein [Mycobacterium interjectum]MCV7088888.1 helix-turn-helix domain-containing protein [Mycobacterium interjectum]
MFTKDQLRQLSYCVGEELRARAAGKGPGVQPWIRKLSQHLDIAVAMSESGHESDCDAPQSEISDSISAREAATVLKLSKRQAQRLGPEIPGAKVVGGRWLFPRQAVEEYARGRIDG